MNRELEFYAALIHAFLTAGHVLGLIYNYRKGNKFDSVIHIGGIYYDGKATLMHIKAAR